MSRVTMDTFDSPAIDNSDSDLEVLDAVDNILDSPALSTWQSGAKVFAAEHVESFYQTVQNAWPKDIDIRQVVPAPSNALRVVYVGDKPSKSLMMRDIARMSLYADEILVADPFGNPFDPLLVENPEDYRFATFQNMRFLKALAPWVRSGIVRFFPNPFEVNRDAGAEFTGVVQAAFVKQEKVSPRGASKNQLQVTNWLSSLARKARQILVPQASISPEEFQRYVEQNPQILADFMNARIGPGLEFDEDYSGDDVQVMPIKGDINLNELLFIAELSGSHPLSINRPSIQQDLQRLERTAPVSSLDPFARALASIDLPFLDNVDASFARELREANRLAGFRSQLRETWKKIETIDDEHDAAREFRDRLQQAREEAEAEWLDIKSETAKWSATSAGAIGTTAVTAAVGAKAAFGAAITIGALAATGPAAGFLIGAVSYYVAQRYKRTSYKKKRPMSVLVDLAAKG